jgi:hypothetical protein
MTADYNIRTMIPAGEIAARVSALAAGINTHFAGTDKLVVVGLLRGSFVFIADLVRQLDLPVEVDFIEASSYGNTTESSREVRILKDLRSPVEGLDVLVVEDIVDTGHWRSAPCCPSPRAARSRSGPNGSASRFRTSSWSGMASTMRRETATCRLLGRWSSGEAAPRMQMAGPGLPRHGLGRRNPGQDGVAV